MFVIQRKLNQGILIGDDIVIKVIKTGESSIKLGIEAPKDVRVKREEEKSRKKK